MTEKDGLDVPGALSTMDKALGLALEAPPKKTLKVDIEKYQAWLDDPALSEQQREQMLEALWQIILCFVDLGFGVSPLENACGQVAESDSFCGAGSQDMVVSKAHTLSETFNNIAAE